MRDYLERVYDKVLGERLEAKGAVLIEGPKWCGKTTTAEHVAASAVYLQDPSARGQYLRLAQIAPGRLLEGENPRLIDEWQDAPELWDAVRFEVDRRGEPGQFILTGSTVPPDRREMSHSGTGRISHMKMRPMSLFESRDSTGAVSLGVLFDGGDLPIESADGTIEQLAFLTCRGGWPYAIGRTRSVALRQAFDYVDAIADVDISRVDGVERSPQAARMLLRSYARMTASQGSLESIRRDMVQAGVGLGETAFAEYVDALRKLFVIDDLAAWNPNLRSRTAIRTSATRHFADPSIATAALGCGPEELLDDLETFGLIFESLCVRDLRAYAKSLDGEAFHYRDKSGLECDAVIRLRNGRYGLIEIKLGGDTLVDEGAKSLNKLAAKIDTGKMRPPSFRMVLTGTGDYSYPREDGVLVVPIRTLAP